MNYLLYVYAKALGTVEAKPEDHTLIGVEEQSGILDELNARLAA